MLRIELREKYHACRCPSVFFSGAFPWTGLRRSSNSLPYVTPKPRPLQKCRIQSRVLVVVSDPALNYQFTRPPSCDRQSPVLILTSAQTLDESLRVMPHCISIPLPTPHIILKRLRNLQHTLNMLHAKRRFLRQRNRLTGFDRVLDL
jgi:hypothetical protein